jgi:FKBP-type peptidyl-prolyl cis-trans isomerase 2
MTEEKNKEEKGKSKDSKGKVKKEDFVEIRYTGYANDEVFDSNVPEDLKKINPKAKPREIIVIVGQGMLVKGLDKALENKEIGKDYEVNVNVKEGFGERKRELIKTIPLGIFTEKKVQPRPGMVLNLDNALAKIIAVSGARVITDFNNPLAGKELRYKFKIVRKVTKEDEKVKTVLELLFKFVPEHEIKEKKVVVKGPKGIGPFVDMVKEKFRALIGKELVFEEVKPKEKDKKEEDSKDSQ